MAVWTTKYINDLPDGAFLHIESGGSKNGDGKTTPRSLRHFPYKDAGGKVDLPHLRNALSRIPQWAGGSKALKDRLAAKAKAILADATKDMAAADEDLLPTVDLKGVAILAAGGPYFGMNSPEEGDYFTVDELKAIAKANKALEGELFPPAKIGHNGKQQLAKNSKLIADDEMPALGWLHNFRVSKGKLLADIKRVPKKFAALVKAGAYPKRSVEISKVTSQADGKKTTYDNVITGLAWLGAKRPAVQTLDDVWALFAEGDVVWDSRKGYEFIRDAVRAALNPRGSYRYWIMDLADSQVLIRDNDSNDTWVVGYEISESGDATLDTASDWVPAAQEWVQAAEKLAAGEDDARGNTKGELPEITLSEQQVQELAAKHGIEPGDGEDWTSDAFVTALLAKELGDAGGGSDGGGDGTGEADAAEGEDGKEPKKDDEQPAPAGVNLSAAEVEALKAQAAAGASAAKTMAERERNELIQQHITEGRVDPAKREFWQAEYDKNPTLVKSLLSEMPVNQEYLEVYGNDDTPEDGAGEDAFYRAYCAATGINVDEAVTLSNA